LNEFAPPRQLKRYLSFATMSKVRFPKRNADGSFCVDVVVAIETNQPEDFSQRVGAWSRNWVNQNRRWARNWFPSGDTDVLNYSDEFKREPYLVSCTSTELILRLEGQPAAKWWRDWLVLRILADLKSSFVEFRDVTLMRNCDTPSSTDDR
jgi:hypothetical protein